MKKNNRHSKMRRRARAQMIVIVLVITILVSILSYIESHYKREAVVDRVDNNVITFVDTLGYEWEAVDVENVVEGQTVVLKMYTNNTNSIISDDIITDVESTDIRMN